MKTHILLSFTALLLLGGCATRREFTGLPMYHEPISHPARTPLQASAIIGEIFDARDSREIDPVFAEKPADEIKRILQEELTRSGLFSNAGEDVPKYRIQGELVNLAWVVPGYERKVRTVFAVSFLTGGLGGLAYGSTSTSVYGDIELSIRVSDGTGNLLLDKTYASRSKEKLALLKSDTPKAMTMIAGKALDGVIRDFIADLEKTLNGEPG